MLYTMQDDDELYGGARRRIRMTPEATAAQEKADGVKKQIRKRTIPNSLTSTWNLGV